MVLCRSENIHTPHRGSLEILKGGSQKPKRLKAKYEAKLEFVEGWVEGLQTKGPQLGKGGGGEV